MADAAAYEGSADLISLIESAGAVEEFRTLIKHLEGRGLQTQVRHGYGQSLLVLIRVPRNLLGNEVYRSR